MNRFIDTGQLGVGVAQQGYVGSGHDHRRADVTAHGVERDADVLRHAIDPGGTFR